MTGPAWSWRETASVLGLGVLLTILLTFPLAFDLGSLGRLTTGDGQYSIWNVAWVAHALVSGPTEVFNANIFHPHHSTLVYSEANLGAGLVAAPVWWVTRNPYLAHNVVVLVGFVLSFFCAYGLLRFLSGSRGAAAVAGILFAFCPYMFARTAHIQLLMVFGLPLCLWAFHRFVEVPGIGRATALGLAMVIQAVFCGYYGVFAGLAVGLGVLVYAWRRDLWRDWRYWGMSVMAGGVAALMVLPLFVPYQRLKQDTAFARPLDEAREFAADWQSYLASATWAHRWMLQFLGTWQDVLFPGFLVTGLGLAGAFALRSGQDEIARLPARTRDAAIFYAILGGLAFWASFGPVAVIYSVLYGAIPIFSFLHAPSRFGILVVLSLSVLASLRLARLGTGPRGRIVVASVGVLATLELAAIPLYFNVAEPPSPVYRALAQLPRGGVAEFPFFHERIDYPRHAQYMLNSTHHWQPLVNGYADYIPADFRRMSLPLSTFPSRVAFAFLREHDTRYAILHLNRYDHRSREKVVEALERYRDYLRPMLEHDDVRLYEIVAWPPVPQ